jgi:hypothetical protein
MYQIVFININWIQNPYITHKIDIVNKLHIYSLVTYNLLLKTTINIPFIFVKLYNLFKRDKIIFCFKEIYLILIIFVYYV